VLIGDKKQIKNEVKVVCSIEAQESESDCRFSKWQKKEDPTLKSRPPASQN